MIQLVIGVDAYMIQDSLNDFYVGQIEEFAVAAPTETEEIVSGKSLKTIKPFDLALYEFDAEVICLNKNLGVIDFGVKATTRLAIETPLGTRIQGQTSLFVDWEYPPSKNLYPGLPPMVYTWKIESINIQTGPYIVTYNSVGGKSIRRDETKIGYRPVERTNAWEDDDKNAFYLLNCTLLDINPKE